MTKKNDRADELTVRLEWPESSEKGMAAVSREVPAAASRRSRKRTPTKLPAQTAMPPMEGSPEKQVEALAKAVEALHSQVVAHSAQLSTVNEHVDRLRDAVVKQLSTIPPSTAEVQRLTKQVETVLNGRSQRQAQLESAVADLTKNIRDLRRRLPVKREASGAEDEAATVRRTRGAASGRAAAKARPPAKSASKRTRSGPPAGK